MSADPFEAAGGEAFSIWAGAVARGLHPDPERSVHEWAEEKRYLSQAASAEPGRYRISRTPYSREISFALSQAHPCEFVVVGKPSQVGISEVGNNWIGQIIDETPGPALIVLPSLDVAKRYSKQRIAPMIQETPALSRKVREAKSRDSGNTTMLKEYPGGALLLTGANSGPGLRSMPIRFLFEDELDAWPEDTANGEGDPDLLARKRTDTYSGRRKIYQCSTPLDKETSRIEPAFEGCDRPGFYYVPCPFCNFEQRLVWGQMVFDSRDREVPTRYQCEQCQKLIEHHKKAAMVADGRWLPELREEHRTVGFWFNAYVSPWKSWDECRDEFLDAQGRPTKLKTWVNTVDARTWQEKDLGAESDPLLERREDYAADDVPDSVLVVTAGVDVHPDRLEAEAIGWGVGEESWSLEVKIIPGRPEGTSAWRELDEWLRGRRFQCRDGVSLRIVACAVDSGAHTNAVYRFCRKRYARRIWAVKGAAGMGRPLMSTPTRNNALRCPVYTVGVDTAKEDIYGRLAIEDPGPGYCHFPRTWQFDKEYFAQLTAEYRVPDRRRGVVKYVWKKRRERNEALDRRVYATAALEELRPSWDKLKENRARAAAVLEEQAHEGDGDESSARKSKRRRRPRRPGGWVKGWRK